MSKGRKASSQYDAKQCIVFHRKLFFGLLIEHSYAVEHSDAKLATVFSLNMNVGSINRGACTRLYTRL